MTSSFPIDARAQLEGIARPEIGSKTLQRGELGFAVAFRRGWAERARQGVSGARAGGVRPGRVQAAGVRVHPAGSAAGQH